MIKPLTSGWKQFLLLCVLAFGPLAFGCVETWSLTALQILIFLLLAVCLCFSENSLLHNKHPLRFLIAAFLSLILLTLLQSTRPIPAGLLTPSWMPVTASGLETEYSLLRWCSYAALLWCVPDVIQSRTLSHRFLWAVLVIGFLIAFVGIIQYGQGNSFIYGLRAVDNAIRNPFGPFYNPNHGASFLSIAGFMGAGIFFSKLIRFRQEPSLKKKTDILSIAAIAFFMLLTIAFGIYKTSARGVMLAIALTSWIVLMASTIHLRSAKTAWLVRAAMALTLAGGTAWIYHKRALFGFLSGSLEYSTAYRVSMYKSGLTMLQDFPLFGIGFGNLKLAFPAYQDPGLIGFVRHIHCDWLELLIEAGFLGFALVLTPVFFFFKHVYRAWRNEKEPRKLATMTGALAAVIFVMLHSLIDFPLQTPGTAIFILSILAWLGVQSTPSPRPRDSASLLRKTWTARLCVGGLSTLLIFWAARPAIASYYHHVASSAHPQAQPLYLLKAYHWDKNPKYSHAIASSYFSLAEASRAESNPYDRTEVDERLVLYRQALGYASYALRADPSNVTYGSLYGTLLYRLKRPRDAQRLKKRLSPRQDIRYL